MWKWHFASFLLVPKVLMGSPQLSSRGHDTITSDTAGCSSHSAEGFPSPHPHSASPLIPVSAMFQKGRPAWTFAKHASPSQFH